MFNKAICRGITPILVLTSLVLNAQGAQTLVGGESRAAKLWLKPWGPGQNVQHQHVQRARVFKVPQKDLRDEALSLLEVQSAVPLTSLQAAHFLGGTAPSGNEVVNRSIADAGAESRIPGNPSVDASVTYASTLIGRLNPYLVRAVAANPGNFVFVVGFCGNDLCVFGGSLGEYNFAREPLVVYLERQPVDVWIDARSAL
jgi:hypothetical protein